MSSIPQSAPARRFKRLPARYAGIVLPFLLTSFMTGIVSFISTVRGVGLHDGMIGLWLTSWGLSWMVAFPTMLIVLPVVKRIVAVVVEPAKV